MVEERETGGSVAMLAEMQQRASFPLSAQIELTRRCNLRCSHCYLDLDGHRGLSTATYRRILDELAEGGSLFVTFTGGELTLRDDWLELAQHARKRHFAVRLMTNGTLLTDDQVKAIADLPVLAVHISLYALEKAHDVVTGVRGSFLKTIHSIERLRGQNVKVLVNVPVMTTTEEELQDVLDIATSMDCDITVDTRISCALESCHDNDALVLPQSSVTRAMRAVYRLGLSAPASPRGQTPMSPWPCLEVNTGLYIRADGELWRCALLPIPFGSVLEMPVVEAWKTSGARKELTRSARDGLPEACRSCEDGWACHRCPGHSYLEHGSLESPSVVDCRLAIGRINGALDTDGISCDTLGGAVRINERVVE